MARRTRTNNPATTRALLWMCNPANRDVLPFLCISPPRVKLMVARGGISRYAAFRPCFGPALPAAMASVQRASLRRPIGAVRRVQSFRGDHPLPRLFTLGRTYRQRSKFRAKKTRTHIPVGGSGEISGSMQPRESQATRSIKAGTTTHGSGWLT